MFSDELLQGIRNRKFHTKFKGVRYRDVELKINKLGRIEFYFGYDPKLVEDVKIRFEGRKWHGFDAKPKKVWSAPITYRNLFQIEVLRGKYGSRPYDQFEKRHGHEEFIQHLQKYGITPYEHQVKMMAQLWSAKWAIWAAEMGLGKTLCALTVGDRLRVPTWYVGPISAIVSANLEKTKWGFDFPMEIMSYAAFTKRVDNWSNDHSLPQFIIFDESAHIKNATPKRSVAARMLTDAMRNDFGTDCYIVEMNGTIAPKNPLDYWNQVEVACPGFLTEANIFALRERLGIWKEEESISNKTYKKLVTWLDDPTKCKHCGQKKNAHIATDHAWEESVDEIAALGRRLAGLVEVYKKKDCLDLPDLIFDVRKLTPTTEMLKRANMIVKLTKRGADALIKLRTLADGFLYQKKETGREGRCELCHGSGSTEQLYFIDIESGLRVTPSSEEVGLGVVFIRDENGRPIDERPMEFSSEPVPCTNCSGTGKTPIMETTVLTMDTPKDDYFFELLDKHSQIGRFVAYAAFTASVNKLCELARSKEWHTIKADGKGWVFTTSTGTDVSMSKEDMLNIFQNNSELSERYSKVIFIGNAGAASTGLTLTASPGIYFYSNDFNPTNRRQAVERIHRIGMDETRGATIYDATLLPSDERVLSSLARSEDLENISVNELRKYYEQNERKSDSE